MKIVSEARKLLLLVPEGPVTSFPEGATICTYGQNNDAPVVVVHNATDTSADPNGTWQGAGPGNFVIVNEVPEDVAVAAIEVFAEHNGDIQGLRLAIELLVKANCTDMYTTSRQNYDDNLSPDGRMYKVSGIMKRKGKPTSVYRSGGKIYVEPNGEPRVIEPDILVRTYRMPDESRIDLDSIPHHNDS